MGNATNKTIFGLLMTLLPVSSVVGQDAGFIGIGAKKLETATECVRIEFLTPGGPGVRGGLQLGDIIVALNGQQLDCDAVRRGGSSLMPNMMAGDKLAVQVLRNDQLLQLEVIADPKPKELGVDPQQEINLRKQASDEILQKLAKTQGRLTFKKGEGDTFSVSGPFTEEEAATLEWHFERLGVAQAWLNQLKGDHEVYLVRFDAQTGTYNFELAKPEE